MTSEKNTITIHLDGSTYNEREKEPIIQQDLLNRMVKRIREDVMKNKGIDALHPEDYFYPEESWNLCYMVKGGRGSGKSFFLNRLTKELTTSTGNPRCTIKKLLSCDPSLMNESHHFILSVVAAINSALDEFEKDSMIDYQDAVLTCRDAVVELASGIARSADKAKYIEDVDKYRISEIRRDSCEFPGYMHRKFSEIIDMLCKLHNIDAMLITIDDVDVYTKQCMDVLETIRLCLACRKCVVVISGNATMYSESIREHYYRQFDKDYHIHDVAGRERREELITELSNQYFLKLFPTNRQYELVSIKEYLDSGVIQFKYDENQMELQKIYGYLLSNCFAKNYGNHCKTLCNLPLRSQINLIKKLKEKNALPRNPLKRLTREETYEFCHSFSDALVEILGTTCLQQGYDFSRLKFDEGYTFYKLFVKYCYDSKTFLHGAALVHDNSGTPALQYIALILAVNAKCFYRDLEGLLAYLLYGPITVAALEHAAKQRKTPEASDRDILALVNNYYGTGGWNQPIPWTKRTSLILSYNEADCLISNGILVISNSDLVECIENAFDYDHDMNPKDTYKHSRARLAVGTALMCSSDKDSYLYLSPYGIYGLMLDCVKDLNKYGKEALITEYRKCLESVSLERKGISTGNDQTSRCPKAPFYNENEESLAAPDFNKAEEILRNINEGRNSELSTLEFCLQQITNTLELMLMPRSGARPDWFPQLQNTNNADLEITDVVGEIASEDYIHGHMRSMAWEIIHWYCIVYTYSEAKIDFCSISPVSIAANWKFTFERQRTKGIQTSNKARRMQEEKSPEATAPAGGSEETNISSYYEYELHDYAKYCRDCSDLFSHLFEKQRERDFIAQFPVFQAYNTFIGYLK